MYPVTLVLHKVYLDIGGSVLTVMTTTCVLPAI